MRAVAGDRGGVRSGVTINDATTDAYRVLGCFLLLTAGVAGNALFMQSRPTMASRAVLERPLPRSTAERMRNTSDLVPPATRVAARRPTETGSRPADGAARSQLRRRSTTCCAAADDVHEDSETIRAVQRELRQRGYGRAGQRRRHAAGHARGHHGLRARPRTAAHRRGDRRAAQAHPARRHGERRPRDWPHGSRRRRVPKVATARAGRWCAWCRSCWPRPATSRARSTAASARIRCAPLREFEATRGSPPKVASRPTC